MTVDQASDYVERNYGGATEYDRALQELVDDLRKRVLSLERAGAAPASRPGLTIKARLTDRARVLRAALIESRYEPVIAALLAALESLDGTSQGLEIARERLEDVVEAFTGNRPTGVRRI